MSTPSLEQVLERIFLPGPLSAETLSSMSEEEVALALQALGVAPRDALALMLPVVSAMESDVVRDQLERMDVDVDAYLSRAGALLSAAAPDAAPAPAPTPTAVPDVVPVRAPVPRRARWPRALAASVVVLVSGTLTLMLLEDQEPWRKGGMEVATRTPVAGADRAAPPESRRPVPAPVPVRPVPAPAAGADSAGTGNVARPSPPAGSRPAAVAGQGMAPETAPRARIPAAEPSRAKASSRFDPGSPAPVSPPDTSRSAAPAPAPEPARAAAPEPFADRTGAPGPRDAAAQARDAIAVGAGDLPAPPARALLKSPESPVRSPQPAQRRASAPPTGTSAGEMAATAVPGIQGIPRSMNRDSGDGAVPGPALAGLGAGRLSDADRRSLLAELDRRNWRFRDNPQFLTNSRGETVIVFTAPDGRSLRLVREREGRWSEQTQAQRPAFSDGSR